jgi:hypothetical protein
MTTSLLTDRYELTMLQAALRSGAARRRSVFEVFARRLPAGRYLLHVRRIGYEPLQGAVLVDTGTVRATLALQVISRVLAKVVVTETSVDKVKQRLDRNGFIDRSHLGISGTFIQRADVLLSARDCWRPTGCLWRARWPNHARPNAVRL